MKRYGLRDDQFSRIEALLPGCPGTGDPCQEMAMSAIPLHFQRRFEQIWATRFGPPVAVNLSKNIGAKAAPVIPTVRRGVRQRPKKNPPA